jgi:hypothetical protein
MGSQGEHWPAMSQRWHTSAGSEFQPRLRSDERGAAGRSRRSRVCDRFVPDDRMHSIDRNGVGRKLGRPPGRTGGAEGLWVDPIARVEIRGGELIECGSVDEAVEIAAPHRLSQIGAIEVRPLWANS